MSVKKEDNGRRSISVEVEVPGHCRGGTGSDGVVGIAAAGRRRRGEQAIQRAARRDALGR